MASPGTRPSGQDSWISYMLGQRAKQGVGLTAIDKASGIKPGPTTNAGAPPQSTPQAMPPDPATMPSAANKPPLVLNGPNMVRNQPRLSIMTDLDRYQRMMGRMPTAAELAVQEFTAAYRGAFGRPPTQKEIMGHLFRQPETLLQDTQDYKMAGE